MNQSVFNVLTFVSSGIVLLPLLIGLNKWNQLEREQRLLCYLLVVAAIVELVANYLWYQKQNNLPVYSFYTLIQFIFLIQIYRHSLDNMLSPLMITILTVGFVMFGTMNALRNGLYVFNSNVITVASIVYIFLSLAYFYKVLAEVKHDTLENNPMFWINSGNIIYFSSSLTLFYVGDHLIPESLQVRGVAWGLHAIFNVVLNLFYTIALWVRVTKSTY